MKRGTLWAVLLSLVGVGGILTAQAATFNSSNFSIDGSLGDSTAGTQTSTNYALTATSGESIAGNAGSKSYKLGLGYVPTLEDSLQVIVQPNGLSAYWPMDDVTPDGGPAIDESQNANNGTYSTSAVRVTGKVGSAWADFNTNQTITVPDSPSLPDGSAMTISFWMNPNRMDGEQGIITKWDYHSFGANFGEWAFQTKDSQLRMFITSGTGDDGVNYVDTTDASIPVGEWTHVALTYDGTKAANDRVRIYLNGVQKAVSVSGTIPESLYAAGTNPITIGNFTGLDRRYSGGIDEMKLYSRALTAREVKAEYAATNEGIPSGISLGAITPGSSQVADFDTIIQTSAAGYTLAINQNTDLTNGSDTIPGVSGSIISPVVWNEGVTKGLGFTLYGTNATSIPGVWSSGAAYAALPSAPTSFYTRSNYTGGAKDILNMRLRLDTTTAQVAGDYTNQMTITGTMIP